MKAFSATAAGTTAYLMAAEGKGGSALLKNVARFQGTAGGALIGQLLFHTLVTCSRWSDFVGFVAVIIFEFFAFYLYLSSPNYGYVGVLFAAYGAMNMVVACDSPFHTKDSFYNTIIDQTMAILCILLGELLVQQKSSGVSATDHYVSMGKTFLKALMLLLGLEDCQAFSVGQGFDQWAASATQPFSLDKLLKGAAQKKDYVKVLNHREQLLACYEKAMDMGNEAPLEPRFYRMPFKETLWVELMTTMHKISTGTCIMEYAVHDCAKGGRNPGQTLEAIVKSPLVKRKGEQLLNRASTVMDLAEHIMKRETLAPLNVGRQVKAIQGMDFLSMEECINDILQEVGQGLPETGAGIVSLVDEDFCLVAVVLFMVSRIMAHVNRIEDACFATPDVSLVE